MTKQEIERMVSDRYTGRDTEMYDKYEGANTKLVDFYDGEDKALNVDALRKNSTKRFSFKVENTTDENLDVVLVPGFYPVIRVSPLNSDALHKNEYLWTEVGGGNFNNGKVKPNCASILSDKSAGNIVRYNCPDIIKNAGHNVDAVADEGTVYVNPAGDSLKITSTTTGSTYQKFVEYIKANPTLFTGIHIVIPKGGNTSIFEGMLRIQDVDPFSQNDVYVVPFQDAFTDKNLNAEKIIIKKDFVFSKRSLAILSVPAGTNATITFVAGASFATDKAFRKEIKAETKKWNKRNQLR